MLVGVAIRGGDEAGMSLWKASIFLKLYLSILTA
jgi:hypothetical protein